MAKEYLKSLRRTILKRKETDNIIPVSYIIVPYAILIIIGIILSVMTSARFVRHKYPFVLSMAVLGILVIITIAIAIWVLYIYYKLIKRRNEHFRRQRELETDIINVVRKLSEERNVDLTSEILNLERIVRERELEEINREPIVWIILSIIVPLLIFYVYYFLTKDYYEHERREDTFLEFLNATLNKLGLPTLTYKREKMIPKRSIVLYIILSIITLGIFTLYWVYVIIEDPNKHFKEHEKWENELMKILEKYITMYY